MDAHALTCASVAVVVYDITDRASFLNTSMWIENVRAERADDVVIMLVGNKSDLSEKRQVTEEEGEELAQNEGVVFIEASAKEGHNIKTLFRRLATQLPGMENTSKGDNNLLEITLDPTPNNGNATSNESGCGC